MASLEAASRREVDQRQRAVLHRRPAERAPELLLRVEVLHGQVQVSHHDAGRAGSGELRMDAWAGGAGQEGREDRFARMAAAAVVGAALVVAPVDPGGATVVEAGNRLASTT